MNTWQSKLKSIGAAALMLCAFAWTGASAQISGTPHNLGSTGTGPNTFSGTAEICVFCHTPHGSETSAEVPLWNRTLTAPGSYTTYSSTNSSTLDGGVAPVGSVSIACLSCHDGSQAMDTMINTPGSGTTAFNVGTPADPLDGFWTGADRPQGIANLGTDLVNDHPIGIQYGGGGITATLLTPADPDFVDPKTALVNGAQVWWVDTSAGTADSREKTDMLLYTRTVDDATQGLSGTQPFVECASCHDPHTANATFLRVANTGSAVCLACHNK
jgi:predicted CXXCH cytochrome family protein